MLQTVTIGCCFFALGTILAPQPSGHNYTAQYIRRLHSLVCDCLVTLRPPGHFVTVGSQFNQHGNRAAPVVILVKCKTLGPAPVAGQVQKLVGVLRQIISAKALQSQVKNFLFEGFVKVLYNYCIPGDNNK